ncbi:MAG: DUF2333 family protein [Rhizobiaceae bacterium]
MLDPVIQFFTRIFESIGRGIGWLIAAILYPFVSVGRWYTRRGWIIRGSVGLVLLVWLVSYLYFFWHTQRWTNFNPDYVASYDLANRTVDPGEKMPEGSATQCATSAIVEVAADLIDFNVNQNEWIPSTLLAKLGLFGLAPWKNTPFFDNKAAFQLGVNQVLRRTSVELVDTLGRIRGTSQIDQNLQDARGNLAFDEETWYFGINPFGPKSPTPYFFRSAIGDLNKFNERLATCQATFDPRADNLMQFLDRITGDIGSTSDILRQRMEASNAGWFDTRADDRFWFAYGQLYAYYGILSAARRDFNSVFVERNLTRVWERTVEQLRATLDITPFIISNGGEASWIMPSHLATMGFYLLRVRSNLVEIRSILDR